MRQRLLDLRAERKELQRTMLRDPLVKLNVEVEPKEQYVRMKKKHFSLSRSSQYDKGQSKGKGPGASGQTRVCVLSISPLYIMILQQQNSAGLRLQPRSTPQGCLRLVLAGAGASAI